MIKKIEIKNVFGINYLQKLNFEVKHLKENQINFENGITKSFQNSKLMLTPILISKNATGKTSLLKAIKFLDNVNSLQDLLNIFFVNVEDKIDRIDKIISWELLRYYRYEFLEDLKNKNKYKYIYKRILRLIKRETSYDIDFHFDLEDNDYNKKNLEEKIVDLKQKLFDCYKDYYISKQFLNEKNVLYSNFFKTYSNIVDNDILIKISYTNNTYDKNISIIDQKIKFNNEEIKFNEINNNILDSLDNKIDNLVFLSNLKEIMKDEFKKKKKYYIDKYKSHYNHWNNDEEQKEKKENFVFINDQIINKKINLMSDRNISKTKDNILNEIINGTSNVFVNSLIKAIDSSISHIEMQNNGLYCIVDKNNIVKNFNMLSFGTIKILIILKEVIIASKQKDKVILIDEIENGLNLSLINLLVKLFTNKEINKNKNQIIITTHNPAILENKIINPLNAFIYYNNKFISPFETKEIIQRTEDQDSIFKNKNYYNDLFWKKKINNTGIKYTANTLFNEDLYDILDLIEEIANEKENN